MTNSITPPSELVQQWVAEIWHEGTPVRVALSDEHIATRAAQWGADQELEACCEWLHWQNLATHPELIPSLRAARRPKPPSLKELALQRIPLTLEETILYHDDIYIIRRALEALDD
jgi:hypothetical protein